MRWNLHRFRPPIVRDRRKPVKAALTRSPHPAALTGPPRPLNSLRTSKAMRDLAGSSR